MSMSIVILNAPCKNIYHNTLIERHTTNSQPLSLQKKNPLAYLEYNKQRQFYHSQYISVMICVLLLVVSIQIEFPVIILKLNEAIQIDSAAMKTYRITGEKTVARQHLPAI